MHDLIRSMSYAFVLIKTFSIVKFELKNGGTSVTDDIVV